MPNHPHPVPAIPHIMSHIQHRPPKPSKHPIHRLVHCKPHPPLAQTRNPYAALPTTTPHSYQLDPEPPSIHRESVTLRQASATANGFSAMGHKPTARLPLQTHPNTHVPPPNQLPRQQPNLLHPNQQLRRHFVKHPKCQPSPLQRLNQH